MTTDQSQTDNTVVTFSMSCVDHVLSQFLDMKCFNSAKRTQYFMFLLYKFINSFCSLFTSLIIISIYEKQLPSPMYLKLFLKILSGRKICPNGPDRTESIVPGSKSTKQARGTYFPPVYQKTQQRGEREYHNFQSITI